MNKGGSLLIELCLAIVILSVMVTISIPNFAYLNRLTVRSELEKLDSVFSFLKCLSISKNSECVLSFDIKNGCYFFEGRHEKLPISVKFGAPDGACGPPGGPNKPIKKPVTFKKGRVVFYPTGIMDSGSVYLVDSSGKYGYALSNAVSHVSHIRKYRFENKSWTCMP